MHQEHCDVTGGRRGVTAAYSASGSRQTSQLLWFTIITHHRITTPLYSGIWIRASLWLIFEHMKATHHHFGCVCRVKWHREVLCIVMTLWFRSQSHNTPAKKTATARLGFIYKDRSKSEQILIPYRPQKDSDWGIWIQTHIQTWIQKKSM